MTEPDIVSPNKKKSSTKSKKIVTVDPIVENIQYEIDPKDDQKKRGRKPRGGKIVATKQMQTANAAPISNVILHLKCSLNDLSEYNYKLNRIMTNPLEYNPEIPPEVSTYETSSTGFSSFSDPVNDSTSNAKWPSPPLQRICKVCNCVNNVDPPTTDTNTDISVSESESAELNIKDVNTKLKLLKIQLYKNAIQSEKKSACFWCTYDFDNTPCYIPKYEMDNTIYGYVSFCRPECAVAFLMKENIDDSTKFERYHILNQIYSRVYNCKKNIKPAPNPYYLLDKFYGTLSIQEYRKLLKTEHLLLVIDKPLTRILPELHEDSDDLLMNIYGLNKTNTAVSGVYKVKRQSEKPSGPTKTSIIRNKFGLA